MTEHVPGRDCEHCCYDCCDCVAGEPFIRIVPLDTPTETITGPAIKFGDDIWWEDAPKRHHDLIRKHAEETGRPGSGDVQGFVTSTGRFVDRHEALEIARAAGQLIKPKAEGGALFSEDMW